MKKKLAIIGASIVQKPLVLKAKEMGVETHCFAWDKYEKDFLCIEFADYYHPVSTLDKEKILEICKELHVDGVTSIANDSCVPTVCYVAEKMGLVGNKYEDSLVSTNKYLMRQAFLKNGVNTPRFVVVEENADYSKLTYPLMVKPTDRSGSIGVFKVEKEEDLADTIERTMQTSIIKQVVVEEFVMGKEVCAECIVWDYEPYILAITETETMGGPHYSKIAYHEPAYLNADEQAKVATEVRKALKALNFICGPCDIEMMITDEGVVKVIEVNPRMGGDATEAMVRLSTGYDFLKAAINLAFGKFEKPVFTLNKYSGIYFLSKETEYLKPIIENSSNDPDIVTAELYDNELHYLQGIEGRSGYLIYQSSQRRIWKRPVG